MKIIDARLRDYQRYANGKHIEVLVDAIPDWRIMDLDFEDDVLPEIERQTGPIPEELKAECKAAGITDAEEVIFPSEMNVDPVELARFKAGFVEHTKKSRGPQTVISEHDKAAAADRQHDAEREATLAGDHD